jgi:hypothetical protein
VNSKKQGDVGLGAAIAWFSSQGFTVLIPLTDSQEYDLVVDQGGRLFKIQVKTVSHRNSCGNFEVELRTKGGNKSGTGKTKLFDPVLIDYLFVLTSNGDRYVIPAINLFGNTQVTLGANRDKYKV